MYKNASFSGDQLAEIGAREDILHMTVNLHTVKSELKLTIGQKVCVGRGGGACYIAISRD